jgi:uncharacterized protein YecE (DUF72 family)
MILIGACGYSYDEWVGPVYPRGTKQADRLDLYARLFPTVEIDSTYYGMPKRANMARLLRAGEGDLYSAADAAALTFSIKAHKSLTHEIDAAQWESDASTFLTAIEPVLESGRLEAVLFQFPYSFHYTPDNRRYLDALLRAFKGVPAAVEFRVAEWYNERVITGMRERGVSTVSADLPPLKGLPLFTDAVTAKTAYIRLHGRNSAAWWGGDSRARYEYLYKNDELLALAEKINGIANQAEKTLVYFNNHAHGESVQNAQSLEKILARIKGTVPAGLPKPCK